MDGDEESLLKGQHKLSLAATYPGLWQRGGRVDWRCLRRVGLVALGRELRE